MFFSKSVYRITASSSIRSGDNISPACAPLFMQQPSSAAECLPTLAFCKDSEITYVNTLNGRLKAFPTPPSELAISEPGPEHQLADHRSTLDLRRSR